MGFSSSKLRHLFTKNSVTTCVDTDWNPPKPLLDLLYITGQEHDSTLESIVKATQSKKKGWLRSGERWHKQEERFSMDVRMKIRQLAIELGYLEEILPKKKEYSRVVVFGASAEAVKDRFEFAVKLFNEGIQTKKLVFLGSTRSLDEPAADARYKEEMLGTEYEADEAGLMQYLFENKVDAPEEMKALEILTIRAERANGRRANTADTLEEWLREDKDLLMDAEAEGEELSVLTISNQPYCKYQGKVAEIFLTGYSKLDNWSHECVGPGTSMATATELSTNQTARILDSIARDLYSKLKLKQAV